MIFYVVLSWVVFRVAVFGEGVVFARAVVFEEEVVFARAVVFEEEVVFARAVVFEEEVFFPKNFQEMFVQIYVFDNLQVSFLFYNFQSILYYQLYYY